MKINKKRYHYTILFIILFIMELIIATYVNDEFIRPYVGDMLVVILIYCLVRIIIPSKLRLLPIYVFIFALSVEALQYLQIVKFLGLENNYLATIIIGSTFDWKDIICYAVGCILIFIVEKLKQNLQMEI